MSIERIGVSAVSKCIAQMGLIFREQPTDDYGIDAQIETFDRGYASGRLIAVQIKSGDSYFDEVTNGNIIFRGDIKHYNYWINHSLPVILVLYNPQDDKCYWKEVNEETAVLTDKSWKIEIPMTNVLDRSAKSQLVRIADNLTEYEKKFNSFLLAKPWMQEIISGNKVILTVQEWINKTSGRGEFNLRILDKTGQERQIFNRSFLGFGLKPYEQVFKELFPWAKIIIDAEFYEVYDEEALLEKDFEAALCTYPLSVGAILDRENFCYIYPDSCPSIEEWMKDVENIRPYRVGAGEVAFYQLVLEINDVGMSFIKLDNFINNINFYKLDKRLLN
ncbi:DUF4365 domain-containing protein [Enterococcus columbae]|uniref:DUF4365 domain-containing protein n=1 Tax=Enterococcus columbae DSM 7374 = ATCC 51263 TaxID=1121865 RepID=S1N572_9ENTE|nr:DUF4365 domain-containing protein [Enterococcus columbae]EOT44867.1 hypothetical protein OMW_00053 [Enterococcus columbae DSM 7374 = ATCC 51263]EOW84160.1 hypothetical protein I568_00647 [Enterococcus columbae DSM 7374 = ATCC 51263]OJG23351.1 hypothetical protein RR47_GL000587 [Enterococcus columbae DSM 7374 = ATCC 51263]